MGRYDYVNRKAARPAGERGKEQSTVIPCAKMQQRYSRLLEHHATVDEVLARWIMHDFLPSAVAVAANHPRHHHFRRALFNNRDEISLVLERRDDVVGEKLVVRELIYSIYFTSSVSKIRILELKEYGEVEFVFLIRDYLNVLRNWAKIKCFHNLLLYTYIRVYKIYCFKLKSEYMFNFQFFIPYKICNLIIIDTSHSIQYWLQYWLYEDDK